MNWWLSYHADAEVVPLADRHYSRKTPGARLFTPPGRKLVLKTQPIDAYWVTSYPYREYVLHAWAGALLCSAFRNEGDVLSSTLITEAVAASRWKYPEIPAEGFVTFVDADKVRRKRDPGRCFRRAGFVHVGETKSGLIVLQLKPEDFPAPATPLGVQMALHLNERTEA